MEKIPLSVLLNPQTGEIELSEEGILNIFEACDASWLHDGNPEKPHAELTSGMCSNAFFDCLRVLKYPKLNELLAQQLVRKMQESAGIGHVDWVIGSAYAAITFSSEVAKIFGAQHGFVEKDPSDPSGKRMVWRRMTIPQYATVLQVEELITTFGTTQEVRRAILEGNSEQITFFKTIGALVHRPPKLRDFYEDNYGNALHIVALIEKEVWAVKPEDCPLCKAGSPRYRPKTHWKELTGKA